MMAAHQRTESLPLTSPEAETLLAELAGVFLRERGPGAAAVESANGQSEVPLVDLDAQYRTLVEQIPAVVFMAYLDRGIGEAYVSPRIEEALGFSQEEWLEDPVRWYRQIHPDDRQRWSLEAAEMFLTGRPLRSAYRVLSRDERVIWFQCEAKMVRREDGRPWFIHGVGVNVTELKHGEAALQAERNLMSAILDTVGALVIVLGPGGRIMRFNRACEALSGYRSAEVQGRYLWELFQNVEEAALVRSVIENLRPGDGRSVFEGAWQTRDAGQYHIAWSSIVLPATATAPSCIVTTGINVTERKRMEKTVLEISAREQRQIAQDLHDGLGQHLTGIAFMSKVLQQGLARRSPARAAEATKIVQLVNEAINKTRELARGLLPVVSDADGLMSALARWALEVEDLFDVACAFHCPEPVLVADVNAATHLYLIAHEAVHNAIKHGKARCVTLSLTSAGGTGTLLIEDDGVGFGGACLDNTGLGLRIMNYRASMVGGALEVRPGEAGGVTVACRFPADGGVP